MTREPPQSAGDKAGAGHTVSASPPDDASNDGVLAGLRFVANELGVDRVSVSAYDSSRRASDPSAADLRRNFGGSWPAVCVATGLRDPRGRKPVSVHAVEQAVLDFAVRQQPGPSRTRDYRHYAAADDGRPSLSAITRRFGTWEAAMLFAGSRATKTGAFRIDAALLARIERVLRFCVEHRGSASTRAYDATRRLPQFVEHGPLPHSHTLARHLGSFVDLSADLLALDAVNIDGHETR